MGDAEGLCQAYVYLDSMARGNGPPCISLTPGDLRDLRAEALRVAMEVGLSKARELEVCGDG